MSVYLALQIACTCCFLCCFVAGTSTIPNSEYDALQALYDSTGGTRWNYKGDAEYGPEWFTEVAPYPCDDPSWQGLTCSCNVKKECNIVAIVLSDYSLTGTLPQSIGNFSMMTNLDLSTNQLIHSIPGGLYSASKLQMLNLEGNHLTGSISPLISNLSLVEQLLLSGNQLSGSLPASLGSLLHLYQFDLSYNKLNGTIPEQFYLAASLSNVSLSLNYFSGSLSESFGLLTALQSFDITTNQLGGSLPKSIGALKSLHSIDFRDNFMTGTIPEELYTLTSLQYVQLDFNQFNGTLSSAISNLTELSQWNVDTNRLTGTIPSEVGLCTKLRYFQVPSNQLNGSIPESIFSLPFLRYFLVDHNQLTGTLSNSFGSLRFVLSLSLSYNHFIGTIPASLCTMAEIEELDISNNQLNGTLPADLFAGLPAMYSLEVNNNQFTGSIPSTIGTIAGLNTVDLGGNQLTGTIPELLYSLPSMIQLALYSNKLNGTISESIGNLQTVSQVELYDNQFSGSLPLNISSLKILSVFSIYGNRFTGPIPEVMCSNLLVYSMYLQDNYLSQSIPECLLKLPLLGDFVAYDNMLTGTLPPNITMKEVLNFEVNNNQLTGQIPNHLGRFIKYLVLDHNQFSGKVPSFVFNVSYEQFSLQDNLLTGSLPSNFLNAIHLSYIDVSHNVLSGPLPSELGLLEALLILFVNNNAFTGPVNCFNSSGQQFITNVDISSNQFTGQLPVELFRVPALSSFAAVSNCFTGSLPEEICSASQLTAVALDGLHTASSCRVPLLSFTSAYILDYLLPGHIPSCLFNMSQLATLHVSGNGVSGSLSSGLLLSESLVNLALSYNDFTGSIPNAVGEKSFENIDLSFNKFTGTLSFNSTLNANASVAYDVNRLSGKIPNVMRDIASIDILDGNHFECQQDRNQLPSHDKQFKYYQCGTTAMQRSLYLWIGLGLAALLVGLLLYRTKLSFHEHLEQWWKSLRSKCATWLTVYGGFSVLGKCGRFMYNLRTAYVLVTSYLVIVLIPTNVALSHYYGNYVYGYAWSVGSLYLSGVTPAVTLLVLLLLFVGWFFAVFFLRLRSSLSIHDDVKLTAADKKALSLFGRPLRLSLILAVALFNFVVILIVNVLYVYISTHYNESIVLVTQVSLACLKLLWNDLVIRRLTFYCKNWTARSDDSEAVNRVWSRRYVAFHILTMIFNVIVIPCIATSAVSADCFFDVLVPPSSVQSSFSFQTCDTLQTLVQLRSHNCSSFVEVTTTTSYLPPYIYRYQCASTLVTTYAVLYVYKFIIVAFLQPLSIVLLLWWCNRLDKTTRLFAVLQLMLPFMFRHVSNSDPATLEAVASTPDYQLFSDRVCLKLVMYLAVFITFGVIFPPLGVMVCVGVLIQTYTVQLGIGRHISAVSEQHNVNGTYKYLTSLYADCNHIGTLFVQTAHIVGPCAGFFYSYILFDTYGDVVGGKVATWMAVVMFVLVCILSFVFKYFIDGRGNARRSGRMFSSDVIELKGGAKAIVVEEGVVNPVMEESTVE